MQRMPVVLTTRWPWMVTACAPPFHIALTTAWMSCWCTSRRLGLSTVRGVLAVLCGRVRERDRHARPGDRAISPAGSFIASAWRVNFATCLLPTEQLSWSPGR